jgi:hypothetical protein
MPDVHDPGYGRGDSESESTLLFLKAYIDEQIRKANGTEQESRKKKWKNAWRAASPITKGTFILTASVAFATVCYAIIAAFQLGAMRRTNQITQSALNRANQNSLDSSNQFQVQLHHFDASLGQEQILAGQAITQSGQTTKLATDTHDVAQKTGVAAYAAKSAAETAKAALIADQRPWISLDVQPVGSLAYDALGWDAGTRWHIPLKYTLKQIGKTPATNVSVFGEIIPYTTLHFSQFKDGKPIFPPVAGVDLTKEFETVCSFPEKMDDAKMGFGTVLFPNDPYSSIGYMNGDPTKFQAAKGENTGYVHQFLVIACVTYRSTLDNSHYRTAKSYILFKNSGNQLIDLEGETIPLSNLGFAVTPFSTGSYAR